MQGNCSDCASTRCMQSCQRMKPQWQLVGLHSIGVVIASVNRHLNQVLVRRHTPPRCAAPPTAAQPNRCQCSAAGCAAWAAHPVLGGWL